MKAKAGIFYSSVTGVLVKWAQLRRCRKLIELELRLSRSGYLTTKKQTDLKQKSDIVKRPGHWHMQKS